MFRVPTTVLPTSLFFRSCSVRSSSLSSDPASDFKSIVSLDPRCEMSELEQLLESVGMSHSSEPARERHPETTLIPRL